MLRKLLDWKFGKSRMINSDLVRSVADSCVTNQSKDTNMKESPKCYYCKGAGTVFRNSNYHMDHRMLSRIGNTYVYENQLCQICRGSGYIFPRPAISTENQIADDIE